MPYTYIARPVRGKKGGRKASTVSTSSFFESATGGGGRIKRGRARMAPRRAKWSATWDNPLLGRGNIKYGRRRSLRAGTNYVAPSSGISTAMRTANNPIITAGSSRGSAVCVEQQEVLTTISSVGNDPAFNLEILDVNPGLSTICSWASKTCAAFQEYKMSFRLRYTSSCPSATPGQLLIAFDHNVGNPTIPNDKQQMSNFAGCVSGQVWAPLTSTMCSTGGKWLYIREGPVPDGQSPQIYDFTKILIATADMVPTGGEDPTIYGTIYIDYKIELRNPRLTYVNDSILFSQYTENKPFLSKDEVIALDYQSPSTALCGVPGSAAYGTVLSKSVSNVSGNLEVFALIDYSGNFKIAFPTTGYYFLTLACYSTASTTPGEATFVAWPDISTWEYGDGIAGFWSIVNDLNGDATKGCLKEQGSDLPDDIAYTEQQFVVWVNQQGTWVSQDFSVNGSGWISCQSNDMYRIGTFGTTNRVNSSFITVSPIGPEFLKYLDPGFVTPTGTLSVTGAKHLATPKVRRYSSGHRRLVKRHRPMQKKDDPVYDEDEEETQQGFFPKLFSARKK